TCSRRISPPVRRPTPTAQSTWSTTPPGWCGRRPAVTDPRKLRPSELCRLLNSTPLGEVINQGQLRRHRTGAGLRVGDDRYVDLIRYAAWLVQNRHANKPDPRPAAVSDLDEVAKGAAALGSRRQQLTGHGQKLTRK